MKKLSLIIIFVAIYVMPVKTFASAPALHIHAFQTAGESAYDEFVSISNDGTSPLDLTNFSVSRKSKTATSWNTLYKFTSGTIAPGQVLMVANPKYTGVADFLYSTSSYSLTADNSIVILAPDKSVTDLVGYGEANSFEGTVLPNPAAGEIYARFQDTNNNLADFVSSVKAETIDPNSDKLVISELMPAPSEGSEWFELYNPTNSLVSLAGLKVCDAVGSVHCYFFSGSEVLEPLQYKSYSQDVAKITMNNTGDWLELRDSADNLLADSGGNYGNADEGISLSLFGSDFAWTKTATSGAQNVFTDTVEVEEAVVKTPKSTSKKVKARTVAKASVQTETDDSAPDGVGASAQSEAPPATVKGTSTTSDSKGKTLGYALISLAVLLLVGYNLWEKRDYARNLYDKIRRRNG